MEPQLPAQEATASRDRKIKDIKDTIKSIVQALCYRWAFDLKIPEQEPPSSREVLTLEQQCVAMIIGICWKDKEALLAVIQHFENEAYAKWRGWVNKPKAERGAVPEKIRHKPYPVSDPERKHLLDRLHQRLSIVWDLIKKSKTLKRFIPEDTNINDSTIPFSLTREEVGPLVILQEKPAEEGVFQAFHRWLRGNLRSTGRDGDGGFLPYDIMQAYLESNGYAVLNGLLSATYPGQVVRLNAKEIVGSYSRVFCILVSIGRVKYLQTFVEHDELNDAHLPFTERPQHFSVNGNALDFFETFYVAQWKFCPPNIEAKSKRVLDQREVLPFTSKKLIGKGSSADIFSIEIHPLYNYLPHDSNTPTSIFALKTYRGKDAKKSWDNEVQAFQKVLQTSPTGASNIIRFYTALQHGNTCHIILEQADRRSLEQYLFTNRPPTRKDDIAVLWKRVLGLIEGLKDLHSGSTGLCHQDVKPSNILVLSDSNTSSSPYTSVFKITDFTTSAPEISLPAPSEGAMRMTPTTDVFSLGCVLSEIAVWVAGGSEYLSQYREDRGQATALIPDFDGIMDFHNGRNMLPVVEEWHCRVVEKQILAGDTLTTKLVPMIEEMLQELQHRGDARSFCTKADRIFALARRDDRHEVDLETDPDWAQDGVYSDADSVFTETDGSQSSATSFASEQKRAVAHLALDEFVALLLGEVTIGGLCAEALSLQILPAEPLWRNLKRLLKNFAKDLGQEGKTDNEKAAAALFQSRASPTYILNGLRKHLEQSSGKGWEPDGNLKKTERVELENQHRQGRIEKWLQKDTLGNLEITRHGSGDDPARNTDEAGDRSEESEEESEQENRPGIPALASVKIFILWSESFAKLQRKLRNFIYPTFASELEYLLVYQSSAQKRAREASTISTKFFHQLEGLVLDLLQVNVDLISIEYGDLCDRWDRTKLYVESIAQRRWDWWPFLDPIAPLKHSSAYVCWTCNCGERLHEVVPSTLARDIEKLLLKYKQNSQTTEPRTRTPADIPLPPVHGQSSSVGNDPGQALSMQARSTRVGMDIVSTPGASRSSPATFGGGQQSGETINMPSVTEQIVFLGVKDGDEYAVAQIPVSNLDDDEFYEALREQYNKLRGVLRRYLSYEVYDYCDFAQLERIGVDEFAPNHVTPSFPEPTDPQYGEYDFKPKPLKPRPPITRHEFNQRFYTCRRGGTRHSHYLKFIPCRKKCTRFADPNGALGRIPKRRNWLDVTRRDREFFWGLLAIERVSFFRVSLYSLLTFSGPFIFWWLWLFLWGHSGDLQNASVPLTIVGLLLSVVWFPLLQNKPDSFKK